MIFWRLSRHVALWIILILAGAVIGRAAEPLPYPKIDRLFEGSMTVVGEPLTFPKTNAGVTSLIVTLKPGEVTGWHRHGVPLIVYILEGTVEVTYERHGKRTYRAGESFLEAMAVTHRALNIGDAAVRILAVYLTGDQAQPTFKVKPGDDDSEDTEQK
jgi:quercetin dioxygenase-like cupin family protein